MLSARVQSYTKVGSSTKANGAALASRMAVSHSWNETIRSSSLPISSRTNRLTSRD